jgi:hypothetical protein
MSDLPPIRTLYCSCCGAMTRGRQYWNQDRGFGLCPKCGDWIAQRHKDKPMCEPEPPEKTHGARGVYWDLKEAA